MNYFDQHHTGTASGKKLSRKVAGAGTTVGVAAERFALLSTWSTKHSRRSRFPTSFLACFATADAPMAVIRWY
jgi:hypothetical protein